MPGGDSVAKKGDMWAKIGVWSYLVGMIIAILISFIDLAVWSIGVLVLLGLIVGLLNIGDSEVQLFLVASVAFVIAANALMGVFQAFSLAWLANLMNAIVLFTAPGALVVAFKALYQVAKSD